MDAYRPGVGKEPGAQVWAGVGLCGLLAKVGAVKAHRPPVYSGQSSRRGSTALRCWNQARSQRRKLSHAGGMDAA